MMRVLIFYCVFLLLLFSCNLGNGDETAVEALIEKTAQERLDNYRQRRLEICRENVLEKAGEIVDSILFEEARLERDTISKPLKPFRPEKPEILTLTDTTPVKPLFSEEERDSLKK